MIKADKPISEKQIQPATLDLRLGTTVYRMRASAIPQPGETMEELITKYKMYDFELEPGKPKELERNAIYIIPLREELALSDEFSALFSPKSSTGRNDAFVQVLSDNNQLYDEVPKGYQGKIYLEITPLSFLIAVQPDMELVQMRIRTDEKILSTAELQIEHAQHCLVYTNNGEPIARPKIGNDSLYLHVDLADRDIVGFEARDNVDKIDLSLKHHYSPDDFWIPIKRPENGELILQKDRFYLLATKERVKIPPSLAAEMTAYDVASGEFRSHYAGFFDPGFGGEGGTIAVLEVRVHDKPMRICDGQRICKMTFERMFAVPGRLYGAKLGSNYTGTGPSLSKHFKKTNWDNGRKHGKGKPGKRTRKRIPLQKARQGIRHTVS